MKKKTALFNSLLLIFLIFSNSQIFSQNYTFQAILGGPGEETYSRIVDAGNNELLILNRTTSNSFGDVDVMLTKLDSIGKTIWTRQIGNSNRNLSRYIYKTEYGFLLILWTDDATRIDDWHILKLDFDGNILQEKFIGTDTDEELMCLVPIDDNKLVGLSNSMGNNGDINFSILNEQLNIQLYHTFQLFGSDEWIRGSLISKKNNVISVGVFRETGTTIHKPLIMNTDLNGELNSMFTFDFSGISELQQLIKTKDNKFLAVGYSNSFGSGDFDILLIKFEENGNLFWVKTIGGNGDDKAFDIHYKSDNTLIITGETSSESDNTDIFMLNIDPNGALISGYTYGGEGNEYYGFSDIDENDHLLITSETTSCDGTNRDILVIKTNEDGIGCSNKLIESFAIDSVPWIKTDLTPEIVADFIGTSHHNVNTKSVSIGNDIVCFNPLKIIGETEFCNSNDTLKYITEPNIILDFFNWVVPEGAKIISSQEDTSILVKFGNKSGYIYLQSEYCKVIKFDSLFVSINGLIPDLGNDTSICKNSHITLSLSSNYQEYLWEDGSDDSSHIVKDMGLYWVTVADENGCAGSDSIAISIIEIPDLDLGPDLILLDGNYCLLDAGPGFNNYYWNDNSTGQTMRAYEEGLYWVEARLNKCWAIDTILIYKEDCKIIFPTIVTPNGDGVGDYYQIITSDVITGFEMSIYNLWGVELFKTNDVHFQWDGTWEGTVLPSGIYVYRCKYSCANNSKSELMTGYIEIFR